jgi:Protein of unknown function (DUF2716)
MSNWKLLIEPEFELAWNFVYKELSFKPNAKDEQLIMPKKPYKKYEIGSLYNEGFSEEFYSGLHNSVSECFRKISNGVRMYALNWQHDCYSFDPYLSFEKDEFDEWLIPVFPNGDYIFFLTTDLANGIFADGITMTLYFFGAEMLNAFDYCESYLSEYVK